MSNFPAVATVIGVSKEVAESGPLLATLAIDPSIIGAQPHPAEPVEIKTGDPVSQAVVDNIIGKLPTKKEPVLLRCDICNIIVSSQEILETHYAGAKHARKLKGQELIKEILNSPHSTFIAPNAQNGSESRIAEFTCKICNVRVNSEQQLQQHLTGSKHKNKAESSQSNTMQVSVANGSNGGKGVVAVDIGPNRLYCAACNVHVNSDLQLHQHITSSKHANKVNGRAPTGNNRGSPYMRRQARGGRGSSSGVNNWRNKFDSNNGWSPSNTGMGLSAPNWPKLPLEINKPFVSGGVLYSRRD
uniref:C2H2-type domain-containing protein n=1 Tax=Homalodisca liturata TaxID=320908 RepID=A0A1B6IWA1_9HEMI